MKLKDGFLLREIAGQTVVLPSGDELELNMMITLNDTGRFLWEQLAEEKTEEQLLEVMLAEYDVSREVAARCITNFVAGLDENGFLC